MTRTMPKTKPVLTAARPDGRAVKPVATVARKANQKTVSNMALIKSLKEIYMNDNLMKLQAVASSYGMYGYFVPWNLGKGTRDEGIYFVLSDKPLDVKSVNIHDVEMRAATNPCYNTRITLVPISDKCNEDDSKAQAVLNTVLKLSRSHKTLEDIFAQYGGGTPLPEYISDIDELNLTQTYALARYKEDGWVDQLPIVEMKGDAAVQIRKYIDKVRNYNEKYSNNPILRALHVPNKDYIALSFSTNPRLVGSKNPIVRMYRYIRYSKSQQVTPKALAQYAGNADNISKMLLCSRYRDPETGKMHNSGTYQKFVREMAEKYPDVLYSVKKVKPFKEHFVKAQKGKMNPFAKLPCYEKLVEVSYSRANANYIDPLVGKINLTKDYNNEKAGTQLHPIPLEEMQQYGDLVVRYIDCTTAIGANVGLIAEQQKIPYAIDDGSHYACDDDGCLAFVFRECDVEFAQKTIAKVVKDFSYNRGEFPERYIVDSIDEPEVQPEENRGFDYSREQAAASTHNIQYNQSYQAQEAER